MLMLALLKRTILRFSAEGSHVIINHKIHKNSPYYMLDKENQLNKINHTVSLYWVWFGFWEELYTINSGLQGIYKS